FPRSYTTETCRKSRLTFFLMEESDDSEGTGGAEGCEGRWARSAGAERARITAATRVHGDSLLSRRVVSRLGVNVEGRKPFGGEQLDFDFPPGAIVTCIAWFISQDILVTQLHSNLGGNIGHIAQAGDWEAAHTRHFCEF